MRSRSWLALIASSALAPSLAACGGEGDGGRGGEEAGGRQLSGTITVDGSSTLAPFAQAAAERFQEDHPEVRIPVGTSGTGGGFEKFCRGETQISNASRPIEDDEEVAICRENNVEFQELQVANDGIAVATNKALPINCLTTDQLRRLWEEGSDVDSYRDLGDGLPDQPVSLFGPGTDSGTFEFFTEEINGEEGSSRRDYQPSEDDNVLVQGVSGEPNGLGYFGFSYYAQNQDKLNLVGVDGGGGCVRPSVETIQSGAYKPLSRPLLMYVSKEAARRPEVRSFLEATLQNHQEIAQIANIVPMNAQSAAKSGQQLEKAAG